MKFKLISDKNRRINLDMEKINLYVSRWKPHTPIDFEVVRKQSTKSTPMRSYYFAAVVKVYGEYLGYDADEILLLHKQLKIVFFQVQPDKKGVHRNRDIPSVFGNESELPIETKTKFLEWVIRCASKDGCYIEPSES